MPTLRKWTHLHTRHRSTLADCYTKASNTVCNCSPALGVINNVWKEVRQSKDETFCIDFVIFNVVCKVLVRISEDNVFALCNKRLVLLFLSKYIFLHSILGRHFGSIIVLNWVKQSCWVVHFKTLWKCFVFIICLEYIKKSVIHVIVDHWDNSWEWCNICIIPAFELDLIHLCRNSSINKVFKLVTCKIEWYNSILGLVSHTMFKLFNIVEL